MNEVVPASTALVVASAPPAASSVATKTAKGWTTGSYTIAFAAIAVITLAALAAPRHSAVVQASDSTDGKPDALVQSVESVPPAQPVAAAAAAAPAVHVTTVAAPVVRAEPTPVPVAPKKASLVDMGDTEGPTAKLASADTVATIAPIASAPLPASATALSTVTITGCLEERPSDEHFRLTDTDGASAPKSRSWKTGFLKKRPAAVNLVGDVNAPALEHQVGKRVAVTGVQSDRDITVNAMRVVSASCN